MGSFASCNPCILVTRGLIKSGIYITFPPNANKQKFLHNKQTIIYLQCLLQFLEQYANALRNMT